jgi:Ca-activated chloride channel family protein
LFVPSTVPGTPTTFDVPPQDSKPVLDQIQGYANNLHTGGNTAIYDSLVAAYTLLGHQAAIDQNRITSIVLLTDGENNTGRDLTAFTAYVHHLPPALTSVPVFSILFGENDTAQMRALAQLTGGLTFDARTQSLTEVFKDIRGYQ